MRKTRLLVLLGTLLVLGLFLVGCEETVDPGAGNGYIELNFDINDIVDTNHYFFMGNNITDSTYFRIESRTGDAIKNRNSGNFLSPLLNVGEWDCDVYELSQAYSGDNPPDNSIIIRRHLNIQVTLERDETERVTVTLI